MAYKDTKIIRYAARLACIHDYIFLDDMTRDIENLSRDKCIESIKTLGAYVLKNGNNIDDPANMLWKQASREAEGIGNKDIETVERWDLVDASKYYNNQRREIEAALCLKEAYRRDGGTPFEIGKRVGVPVWTLHGWTDFQRRIPWKLVLSIEALQKEGESEITVDEAIKGMNKIDWKQR